MQPKHQLIFQSPSDKSISIGINNNNVCGIQKIDMLGHKINDDNKKEGGNSFEINDYVQKNKSNKTQIIKRSKFAICMMIITNFLILAIILSVIGFQQKYCRQFNDWQHQRKFKSIIESIPPIVEQNIPLSLNLCRKTYNPQNSGTAFGRLPQFAIEIPQQCMRLSKSYKEFLISHNWYNIIQVGSVFDYAHISEKVDFGQLSQDLQNSIAYQEYTFCHQQSRSAGMQQRESNNSQVKQGKKGDEREILDLGGLGVSYQGDKKMYYEAGLHISDSKIQFQLAKQLVEHPYSLKLKKVEYYHYNKKYDFGQYGRQLPMCICSTGYRLFSKNRYTAFFESLERQNYTNFRIVYIDDNSPKQEFEGILRYLERKQFRINGHLTFIHTTQHIGSLGNLYFFSRKYCKPGEIVVNPDSDDALIGHQVFKIINSIYQKQNNIRFTYTNNLNIKQKQDYIIGSSKKMRDSASQYRISYTHWDISHMRAWRKQLLASIPLQMMIEYHRNEKSQIAYPQLYRSASDTFQIFPMIQMAGDENYRYITDFLYLYYGVNSGPRQTIYKKCYSLHQKYDEFKSRIKTPLMKMKSLQFDTPRQRKYYSPPQSVIQAYQYWYKQLFSCVGFTQQK